MHLAETCTVCKRTNFVYQPDGDDPDCSKMDTTDYTCWSCGSEIRMVAGEFGDVNHPHAIGTMTSDEYQQGDHCAGLQFHPDCTPSPKDDQ